MQGFIPGGGGGGGEATKLAYTEGRHIFLLQNKKLTGAEATLKLGRFGASPSFTLILH